jgi:predicted DCC family thiol-disulfide oxidoreductase YuxK
MILLFDEACVLCSGSVGFILRHERDKAMLFAGTGSEAGRALAASVGLSPADLDETFVVIDGTRVFLRSDAALQVARHLKAPWAWLALLRVVPRALRDALYTAVARRRYRLFGRRDRCFAPPPAERSRFLGIG